MLAPLLLANGAAAMDASGELTAAPTPLAETWAPAAATPTTHDQVDPDLDLGQPTICPGDPTDCARRVSVTGGTSGSSEFLRLYGHLRQLPPPPPTSYFQLVPPNYLQRPNYQFHITSDWRSWATLGAGFTQLF